jgi:hypothetical protein
VLLTESTKCPRINADESQVEVLSWKDVGLKTGTIIGTQDSQTGNDIVRSMLFQLSAAPPANPAAVAVNVAILDALKLKVKVGDSVVIAGGTYIVQNTPFLGLGNQNFVFEVNFGKNYAGDAEDTVDLLKPTFYLTSSGENKKSRQVKDFEIIWKPMCLSIFKYSGAMPLGKYELVCMPHNDSGGSFQTRAIETAQWKGASSVAGIDFNFLVKSCQLFIAQVEGPRVEDQEYYVGLENTRVQMADMTSTNTLTKEAFNVSPTTYGLTIAYQGAIAGSDTRRSVA